jgi:CheY-like chemotaxis protein/anti-sigma regulatory factor (Ser/Thr protein kinase)
MFGLIAQRSSEVGFPAFSSTYFATGSERHRAPWHQADLVDWIASFRECAADLETQAIARFRIIDLARCRFDHQDDPFGRLRLVENSDSSAAAYPVNEIRQLLEPIRTGTERIGSITRELRTFSRPEVEGTTIVDVRAAVTSVLQLVGKDVETRARLVVELGETAPVRGHQARFVQVILNLVVNAMQALPGNRPAENEISVRSRNEGDKVVIEVADSGPGVPAKDRDRIFAPFVSTKDIGQGTGLGLFVCRNIARAFSGDVEVVERSGGGAVFRVTLPAATGAPEKEHAKVASVPKSPVSGHVLLIDDEPLVARALGQQLLEAGYQVTIAEDVESVLDQLVRDHATIDLVLCDLMMRQMTGMDFSAALQARNPAAHAKTVFMTGGAFTPQARAFVDDYPDKVVEKPFDVVAETDRRLRRLRER